ncbi:MAG: tetratricopeptide repeat protein, partial [Planctomycetota bacterium]|nr:tetratricopeptide repeat protein [Planctomycetota bacterium]
REFKLPLGPGDAEKAARFADRCVELRNDTDRALKVAEKMYRALTEANASDLEGFLGLARCYELGFRFDDAFSLYRSLTEGRFSTEPAAWARLGELMAQFRLFDRAEESFREGLRARRTDWEANWRFGRFLLDRGRADEAIEVLEQAALRQPTGVEWARTRAGIRADLGACLLHLGRVQESHDAFQGVVSSDPSDDRGLAGVYSAALFLEDAESPDLSTVGQDVAEASFDLLLALGLQAIDQQEWSLALRSLERAVRTDPFRAWQAWRALSWLAEITGHPEEAYSYIERAYLAEPTDPWILYQLARLLTQQGDVPGAMSAYREALDRNLNFADALIGLAHLSQLTGEFEAAERYYHRALSIDPGRPVVHSLRGFNHFSLGNTDLAGQSFQEARELDEQLWSAKNGLAWWFYATGRSGEAINQFGYVINDAPNGSDHRQYADDQVKRIQGHELKEVWTDRFDRVGSIQNGWSLDEKDGVISNLKDGQVWLEGVLDKNGRGRVYQQLPAERFLAVEATVTIHDLRDLNGGLFVSKEQPGRADEVRVTSKVALRRDKGGKVQVTFFRKGSSEEEVIDLPDHSWRDGEARRVRIETNADASHTRVSVYIDGLPVLQDLEIQSFGRSQNPVRFGVFVEGTQGRTARISVDDVNVIRIK